MNAIALIHCQCKKQQFSFDRNLRIVELMETSVYFLLPLINGGFLSATMHMQQSMATHLLLSWHWWMFLWQICIYNNPLQTRSEHFHVCMIDMPGVLSLRKFEMSNEQKAKRS